MILHMNICLTNDSFPPTIDGVANVVLNYAKELTAAGTQCTVVTPHYPGVTDDYDFPVIRFPSLDTTPLIGYRLGDPLNPALVLDLAEKNYDLVHTHCPFASMVLSRRLRNLIRKPLVFTYHTKYDIEIQRAVQGELLQKAAAEILVRNISACDEVWTVSQGAGENLRQLGWQGEYIVMPNGVDLPKGRVSDEAVQALKQEYSIPSDSPVFLFVGRMMWYKGIRLILDGLKILKENDCPFTMVFVGDGQEKNEIQDYAASLQLTDVCRFIGSVYNRDRIRTWYCCGDLLLFPSSFDTNGLVVREASACGLASVLIQGSCAAEGVTNAETGILIEENAEALAAVLQKLPAEQMHILGEHAMERIYLSWKDSVAHAAARYAIIQDKWNRGDYPLKEELPSDDLLSFFKDVRDTRNEFRDDIMMQYMKMREDFLNRIERYL